MEQNSTTLTPVLPANNAKGLVVTLVSSLSDSYTVTELFFTQPADVYSLRAACSLSSILSSSCLPRLSHLGVIRPLTAPKLLLRLHLPQTLNLPLRFTLSIFSSSPLFPLIAFSPPSAFSKIILSSILSVPPTTIPVLGPPVSIPLAMW